MSLLGLDYEAYEQGQFLRVVEFSRNGRGEPISGFDDDAKKMAIEVGKDLDATEAELLNILNSL